MFDILKIDGTSGNAASDAIADLLYDPRFDLASYVPGITTRRRSQLGGRGPYVDVVDTLQLHASGPTPAAAYAALDAIAARIDQAELFWRGEPTNPVILYVRPQFSTEGAPSAAAVLGWEGERPVAWPWPKPSADGTFVIRDVTLRFRRAGLWTLPPRCINYVADWSFEENTSTSSLPTNWLTTTSGGGTTVIAAGSIGTPIHGTQRRQVQNAVGAGVAIMYQDVTDLVVGASYRVSVYALRESGAGTARLTAYDGGGLTNGVTVTTTAAAFTRLELTKVCPAGGSIRVALESTGSTNSNFDAVILEALPATGAASPVTSIDGVRGQTTTNADVMGAMFGEEVTIPSPVRVEVRRMNASSVEQVGVLYPSILSIVSRYDFQSQQKHLTIANAVDMVGGSTPATYTSVVATATNSRSGNVLQYAPAATTEVRVHATKALTMNILSGAPVVFLVVQAGVSNQFTIRGYMGTVNVNADLLPNIITSDPVTIVGTQKQVIALRFPEVLPNILTTGPRFLIGIQSTAASSQVQIDTCTFLATDHHPTFNQTESNTVPAHVSETTIASYLDTNIDIAPAILANLPYRLLVDPNVVTKPDGIVGVAGVFTGVIEIEAGLSYLGTPDVYLSGDRIAASWLAPDATNWRYTLTAVVVRTQLIVTRRKAFLVPQ